MMLQDGLAFGDTRYDFDPVAYWGPRASKVYVVTLHHPIRRGKRGRRGYAVSVLYVRARAPEGAARTARRNSFGKHRIAGMSVRLAMPTDLGAVPAGRTAG